MKKLFPFLFFVSVSFGLGAQSQAICGGNSATITPITSATTPTMNPGGLSPAPPTATGGIYVVSPTVTTTYTIITSIATATPNVYTYTNTINTITVNPKPVLSQTITQSTCTSSNNCFNLGLTFNPPSPVPGYTVTWTGTPAVVPNGVSGPTQYSTSCTGTNYIFPGIYSGDITAAGGCAALFQFTINSIPAPASFTTSPAGNSLSVTCLSPTVVIVASNTLLTYTWTAPGMGTTNDPTLAVTSSNQGTITGVATNTTSGCTATTNITLSTNTTAPISAVSPTYQTINCTNLAPQIVTLTATSPTVNFTHEVTPPPVGAIFTSNNFTAGYLPGPGTFTYVLRDNVNGCTTTKQFTVFSTDGFPTFTLNSNQNFTIGCNSKSVTTISIPQVVTQPSLGSPVQYCYLPPGATSTVFTSGLTQTTITTPGTWTVLVKDVGNGCITPQPMSIVQTTAGPKIDTVFVPFDGILTCDHPTMTIVAHSEAGGLAYNWSYPTGGTTVNVATPSVVATASLAAPTQTLANSFTLSLTDPNSACVSKKTVPILQNVGVPIPLITSLTTSLTCATKSIVLTNASKTATTPPFPRPLPAIGFSWKGPSPQTELQNSTTYVAAVPGPYTLTTKDLNNGCTATTTSFVIGNNVDYPKVNTPDPAPVTVIECGQKNDTLRPSITSASTGLTYSWTAPLNAPTPTTSLKNLPVTVPGIYTVLVTNPINECASSSTMSAVNGSMTADITPDVTFGYSPLTVNFTNNSRAGAITSSISTVWSFGNGTSRTTTNTSISPQIIYNQAGTYTVSAYASRGTCLASVKKVIVVESGSTLVVPNVFTPNGDNVNDLFFLRATGLAQITIRIYDRWGAVVYDLVSTTGNVAWDGKNLYGKECAEGTYYYILKTFGHDGIEHNSKGTINLFR